VIKKLFICDEVKRETPVLVVGKVIEGDRQFSISMTKKPRKYLQIIVTLNRCFEFYILQ
jgi:hypothetical protein